MSMNLIPKYQHAIALGLATCVCVLIPGCFGSSGSTNQRELVQGIIFCGRVPLSEGVVRFEPDDQHAALPVASGDIQSNGEFQLETDQGSDLLPGRYRVIVTDATGSSEGEIRNRAGQVCLYGDTGQTAQVIAGGVNQFRFAMAGPEGPRDMPEGE
ncbi:hypothetical protein [Bremerella alba]|uniref:Uncharacterized protein n=1 Tax=Bremerella alba TaxID=980252 RepID=A0A7V8V282_9BACT|nr:hypothetical protein [Bremerella alba]MBA2113569.1 hypothetical protein [Bremerella alba]